MSVVYTLAVCAIIFLIAIEFVLSIILSRLDKIHTTLDLIHQDLVRGFGLVARKQEHQKKRIYYLDENGQRRWRKND